MISGVENHDGMTSTVTQATGDEYNKIKLMNNGTNKVNVSSHYG
jgi:hypothetical protein